MDTKCADEQYVFTKVNADLEEVACETCVKDNTKHGCKSWRLEQHKRQHAPAAHIRTGQEKKTEKRRRWKGEKERRKAR